MSKKRVIGIIVIIICILVTIIFVCFVAKRDEKKEYASRIDQIEVVVSFESGEARTRIWQKEDGEYYLFLPSGTESIRFYNLTKDSYVEINDVIVTKIISENDLLRMSNIENKITYVQNDVEEEGNLNIMLSENIASVFITSNETQEQIDAEKGGKKDAHVSIFDNGGEIDYRNSIEYIKTRGNSTFYNTEKKSYEIRLNSDSSILGMDLGREWILLANSFDSTLLKNNIVYSFANKYEVIAAPQGKYVDLYINGEYRGNYYLCQKVKNNDSIINIDDETYVVEKSIQVEGENSFCTNSGAAFIVHNPKKPSESDYRFLISYFNELEDAVSSKDGLNENTGKYYYDYLDMDSWEQHYLIDNVFANSDSSIASSFFYLKKGDKIYSGPIWDYDLTLFANTQGGVFNDSEIGNIYLSEKLINFEKVKNNLEKKFYDIYKPYIEYEVLGDLYYYARDIKYSYYMNSERWNINAIYTDYFSNVKYMNNQYNLRVGMFEKELFGNSTKKRVEFIGYNGELLDVIYVENGDVVQNVPSASNFEALFAGWVRADNGEKLKMNTPIYEDTTYIATWIDFSIILNNTSEIIGTEPENIDTEALEQFITYIKENQ